MLERIMQIDADRFQAEVLDADAAIVDFYSTECPPCENLAGKFGPLSELYGEDVKFVKIFRQGNRDLAKALDVSGSPTLLFFSKGMAVGQRLTGGIRRGDIMRNLDALLPPGRSTEIRKKIIPKTTKTDVVVLGGGPAGLTAGIYLAQAHVDAIIVDKALPGGYVATTNQVSNYPGFVDPLNGYELSHQMTEQAKANGVKFRAAVDIDQVDLENKTLRLDGYETISARKIVIATGSQPAPLGVPGEKEYRGNGISHCAICDAKYYDGMDVVVIGGGNSAIEESLFIAKFAKSITIVHRSSALRANKEAQAKAAREPRIKILLEREVKEFRKYAPFRMGVLVRDKNTGEVEEIKTNGVFVFVGFKPNVDDFGGGLKTDRWGYIEADAEMRTSVAGVFSAGDVNSKHYRQITTAVSDGTIAAIGAAKELG